MAWPPAWRPRRSRLRSCSFYFVIRIWAGGVLRKCFFVWVRADSLRPVQHSEPEHLRIRKHVHHGREIRSRAAPPVNSLFQVLFENFRIESFFEAFTGVGIVVWMAWRLHLHWKVEDALLLIFFSVCGGIIYVSFFLLLSTFSFWFEDRVGVHPPFWNLLMFGRYPLTIYSGAIKFFLSWVVPFGFATFYPGARLLARGNFHHIGFTLPLVSVTCAALAVFSWNFGVRHYSSTGS